MLIVYIVRKLDLSEVGVLDAKLWLNFISLLFISIFSVRREEAEGPPELLPIDSPASIPIFR